MRGKNNRALGSRVQCSVHCTTGNPSCKPPELRVKMAVFFSTVNLFCKSRGIYAFRIGSFKNMLNGRTLLKFMRTTPVIKGSAPTHVLMPALSPTMEEGTIVSWLKKEGDVVNPGDALCEIETDKATITMDTDEEGILAKILVPSGSEKVKVNDLIALIVEEGEDYTKISIPITDKLSGSVGSEENIKMSKDEQMGSLVSLSPAVRFLIETNSLDAKLIPASGPGGRILKGDILRYMSKSENTAKEKEQPATQILSVSTKQVPAAKDKPKAITSAAELSSNTRYSDIPNTSMRTTIAKRLTESKSTIPHVYASTECVVDNLQLMRLHLQEKNIKVSVNDLIVKIAGATLKQIPEMNSVWDGSKAKQVEEIDIAVDVAIDGGIISPVIRDASNLDVSQVSLVLKDLVSRARGNSLHQQEFQGGSFTISNLGMFGVTEFSAVITPPQTAVLAVGGIHLSLSAEEVVHTVMTVTLSCDGRVVDNELASQWLKAFKENIEKPTNVGL